MQGDNGREESKLLSVPKPMTSSSSAETLTDNTLTAPSTPTVSLCSASTVVAASDCATAAGGKGGIVAAPVVSVAEVTNSAGKDDGKGLNGF